MKIICTILLSLLGLSASRLEAAILSGPITNANNGHLYYLLSPTNWHAAEAQAIGLSGHMATINDATENAWVVSTFGNFGGVPRTLWIGLNDTASEELFVWIDGDASAYRNWAAGEPNNGAGYFLYEDHGVMRSPIDAEPGKWNDAIDTQNHAAVVEVINPTPIIVAGPITNSASGHFYYLLSPTDWNAAENIAITLGGHLASINDAVENDWVYTNFSSYVGTDFGLWLGLNDAQQEGQFFWLNIDPAFYQNWAAGEPNDGAGFYPMEDQAVMRGPSMPLGGQWNDAMETQAHYGVVEVGPPAPLPSVASTIRVSQVEISWNSSELHTYQVQYRTNGNATMWFNLGSLLLGTGGSMSITDDVSAGSVQKYYRVTTSP